MIKSLCLFGDYEIKTGKYCPYVSHQGINKGLSPYIDSLQKKLEEFKCKEIKSLIFDDYIIKIEKSKKTNKVNNKI